MVDHIDFLVEEASIEAALRLLLPRIIGDTSFAIYPHQCKENLLDSLPNRMRGYAAWLPESYRVVVVVDCDDDDCMELKGKLEKAASDANLATRTRSGGQVYRVVNRIAIEELEAWFFGDWNAVCQSFPKVNRNVPNKQSYRDPDRIAGGTWEALERVLKQAGHFKSGLRKIEAARSIAEHMDPAQNRSLSFQVFRNVLIEMTS
jgi:hypothetical protein